MTEIVFLVLSAAIVNNVVLAQFLGLCPLFGSSQSSRTALPMAAATIFVLVVAGLTTHLAYQAVLVPLSLEYLRLIVFIALIAATVQGTEMFVRLASPVLYEALGIYLPLITTNCAVLGVVLLAIEGDLDLVETFFLTIGAGAGFSIAIVALARLRERVQEDAVPPALRGIPIAFITIGFMALAVQGLRGIGS